MAADRRGEKGRRSLNGKRSTSGLKNKSPLLAVRIAPELMARVDAAVAESGQSKPDFVRLLLTEALDARERLTEPGPAVTTESQEPASRPKRKRKTKPATSKQLVFDLSSEPDWRAELFTAHQDAVEARNAEGSMVAIDVLAQRLGWSVEEVRRRVARARGERWGMISRPIHGVDDVERVNITAPPKGSALLHAGAAADLREWRQLHRDASERLGITETRLNALVELRAVPARWERQRLMMQAKVADYMWPDTAPGEWTPKRAAAALRAALPEDRQTRAEVARRCDVKPPSLSRWADGASRPSVSRRPLVEAEFAIPEAAWDA